MNFNRKAETKSKYIVFVDYFVVLVTFTCLKPFTSANAKEAKLFSRHNFSYVYCVPRFCQKIYIRLTCRSWTWSSPQCGEIISDVALLPTCSWSNSWILPLFLMRLIQFWMSNCVCYNLAYAYIQCQVIVRLWFDIRHYALIFEVPYSFEK